MRSRADGPTWLVGIALIAGSVVLHAFVGSGALRERQLQARWSAVVTCLLGPPLGRSESPSSRSRARRLVASAEAAGVHDAAARDARRADCRRAASDLREVLDPDDPREDVMLRELVDLDGADRERLVGAALARGLGHQRPSATATPENPAVTRVNGLPVLDRAVVGLGGARADPVTGRHPSILFSGDGLPHLCRWSSVREPLDHVACRHVPAVVPGDELGRYRWVLGASLGDARALVTRIPDGDGFFDARDGAPVGPASWTLASLREDGAGLVANGAGMLQVLTPGTPPRTVATLGRGSGLALVRDLVWTQEAEGVMNARFIHVDDDARAHVVEASGAPGVVVGCEAGGTRAFVAGDRMALASPGRPFQEAVAIGRFDWRSCHLTCLRGGGAVVTRILSDPRAPMEHTLLEERLSPSGLARREAAFEGASPLTTDADGRTLRAAIHVVSVEADVVIARASPSEGVVVRRAPIGRVAATPPSTIIDDLDTPILHVRLVTDGHGVVLLLDDGHLVRALRQRPDGSWVPQVATSD